MVEEKISERGFPSIRVTVEYDHDILTLVRASGHGPTRVACDLLIQEVYNVKQYGVNLVSFYQRNIKVFPVAERDLYAFSFVVPVNQNHVHQVVWSNEID